MPKKKNNLTVEEKERIAAQLLAASEGMLSTAEAMKSIGMTTPQRSESRKKKVYRRSKDIRLVSGKDASVTVASSTAASTPRQLMMEPNSQDQSVSSLSAPPSNSTNNSTNHGIATGERDELRRQLDGTNDTTENNNLSDYKSRLVMVE